jgi:hypothetical protein
MEMTIQNSDWINFKLILHDFECTAACFSSRDASLHVLDQRSLVALDFRARLFFSSFRCPTEHDPPTALLCAPRVCQHEDARVRLRETRRVEATARTPTPDHCSPHCRACGSPPSSRHAVRLSVLFASGFDVCFAQSCLCLHARLACRA